MLQEQKAGVPLLKKYQTYVAIHLRGRSALFQWQLHHKVSEIPADIFQYLTAEKFMHYMEANFRSIGKSARRMCTVIRRWKRW